MGCTGVDKSKPMTSFTSSDQMNKPTKLEKIC